MNRSQSLAALLLGITMAVTWWLSGGKDSGEPLPVSMEHEVDYYLADFTSTETDVNGRPARRLVAERMSHFKDDDSTELLRPNLTIYEEPRPPWRVVSESGWVSPDGEVVLLRGEVHIDRDAGQDVRPLNVVTRDLRVQPKHSYAETDQPAILVSAGSRIDTVGVQAWFSTPTHFKFLSRVRGHYEVN